MRIVGFVGISGSGKSYRAVEVALEEGIKYIIDDGLLISDNKIIAGVSAKKEKTKIASIKNALFVNKERAEIMRNAIKECNPTGILILGTSHDMVERITRALELPLPEKFIEITDIATKDEIEHAREVRKQQGKHVIPVPTFEIKKDFSGYWMDALKRLKKNIATQPEAEEKSVVRPTFSYLGEFNISKSVLVGICTHEAKKTPDVEDVLYCIVTSCDDGVNVRIEIIANYGKYLPDIAKEVMKNIKKSFETATAMNINHITVVIKGLTGISTGRK